MAKAKIPARKRREQGGAFVALRPTIDVAFPAPVMIENQYHFHRADIENYKRAVAGLDALPVDPKAPIVLVKLATFAKELDRHPFTIKRQLLAATAPASVKRQPARARPAEA